MLISERDSKIVLALDKRKQLFSQVGEIFSALAVIVVMKDISRMFECFSESNSVSHIASQQIAIEIRSSLINNFLVKHRPHIYLIENDLEGDIIIYGKLFYQFNSIDRKDFWFGWNENQIAAVKCIKCEQIE